MIALFIITSVIFVVVVFVVFTIVVDACLIATVDGVAMARFLSPFVQVNAISSAFWVEERGHGIWETTYCVWHLVLDMTG